MYNEVVLVQDLDNIFKLLQSSLGLLNRECVGNWLQKSGNADLADDKKLCIDIFIFAEIKIISPLIKGQIFYSETNKVQMWK